MVDSLKNNFLLFPALVLALLLYFVVPQKKSAPAEFLFEQNDIRLVECRLVSNPVKVGDKKKRYAVKAKLISVADKGGGASSADGQAQIFLPVELCEIYQPGKLYSAWRGEKIDFLLDKGARCVFKVNQTGENGESFFSAQSLVSCAYGQDFWGRIQKFRALCRLHFCRLMFAWGEAGGLLLALLTGSRSYLDEKTASAFRLAGLSHILALSGMHLSLFSSIALFFGKKSLGKKAAPAMELSAIVLFVWFAGKTPSLFRALLCSFFPIFFRLLKIQVKSGLNVLSLAFIMHICLFPSDMGELSFMLSYGALFGILAFNEFVSKPLLRVMPAGAGSAFGQSIGAQAVTMPICARFFGTLAPGGILSSAVISPLVSIFIYLGLFFILISAVFPALAPFCGGALCFVYKRIKEWAILFSQIPCVKL